MILMKKEMIKMNKSTFRRFRHLPALLLLILVLAGCNHHRNDPGYAYMAELDMYYSVPYDAYTPNPVFSDSLTMQVPPEGTIPRGKMPYPYKPKSMDEQILAGQELVNPVEPTAEAIAEGREQYQIFCAICHGDEGDGKGFLYTSKRFTAVPRALNDDYVRSKPDGEVYHVITMGTVSGLMGPHGGQIRPEDRWKIIHYMRTLAKN
jgi:mono/diheme cytochrome c family protein